MKRFAYFFGVTGILLLAIASWNLLADSQEQRQDISLKPGFKVGGVQLKAGDYVVIHRSQKDSEGAACTYFYRAPYYRGKAEVAKVRCQLTQGKLAQEFTLESSGQPDGTQQIRSIQFVGSTDVHNLETGG